MPRRARHLVTALLVIAGIVAFFAFLSLGLSVYMASVAAGVPSMPINPVELMQRTTVVYASDGSVLADWHGEQDRTIVPYQQMPKYLLDAVVAIEDRRFYQHQGIDVEAIARALGVNAGAGAIEQGGSTITQQVIKLLFVGGKRTFGRKVKEAIMANALEEHADKGKVLEIYLNTVYFGRGLYGVETASQRYFGKRTIELTLPEAATLAGVIRSPNRLNPVDDPKAAQARRDLVLDQMVAQGYIGDDQAAQAKSQKLNIVRQDRGGQPAPYFAEYVRQALIDRLGAERVYGGGLRVYTTLDPALQRQAEKAASALSGNDPEVALVALRHDDGSVLAMVGGRDYSRSQFNLAVQARRQPGSSFKPFVLATALERGIGPNWRFDASPYSVRVKDGMWNVQNYENEITSGRLTLRAATQWSVNAVFARLIMRVGPDNVVKTAKKMGIVTPLQPDPAIALGGLRIGVSPLEMASAYGTIANSGAAVEPSGIVRVLDDEGRVVYQPDHNRTQAISRESARTESSMLHDVIEHGTGGAAKIGRWAAGKTGTTQSYRDAWFVGWSGDLVTAVWVGNRSAQVPMTNVHGIRVAGGTYPARIWKSFMGPATDSRSSSANRRRGAKSQLVKVTLCVDSLQLATSRCPESIDVYVDRAAVPKKTCTIH